MSSDSHSPAREAPFGSWKMDRRDTDLIGQIGSMLSNGGNGYVAVVGEQFAFKRFDKGDPLNELDIMLLVGTDCSIQPVGRILDKEDILIGFIMPLEMSLAPSAVMGLGPQPPRPTFTLEKKRDIINKLCHLVQRVHAKGFIHGDVKPANILLCSDGEVRFCDWALASAPGRPQKVAGVLSVHYSSPRRCRFPLEPPTRAEDLWAIGISIWEIWMDHEPFDDVDDDVTPLEELIAAGLRPDLDVVDDPAIAALIAFYLEKAPPLPDELGQTFSVCTQTDVLFRHCRINPPHHYTKVVQCVKCTDLQEGSQPCVEPYRMPTVKVDPVGLWCPKCNSIEYRGL